MFYKKTKYLILIFFLSYSLPLFATSFNINTTHDTHDINPGDGACDDGTSHCSIRAAIEESNAWPGADEMIIPANSSSYLLTLNSSLSVTEALTIIGDSPLTSVLDFNNSNPPFIITGGTTNFSLSNIKLTHGNTADGSIIKHSGNLLTLTRVRATDNLGLLIRITGGNYHFDSSVFDHNITSESVSVLLSSASGSMTNCLFYSNSSDMFPIVISISNDLNINNSLITHNVSSLSGRAINTFSGIVTIQNSLLSDNHGVNCEAAGGTFTSNGNNLEDRNECGFGINSSNVDILLGNLDITSAALPFYFLQNHSPALNAGNNFTCASNDIRDVARPQSSNCDIGPFEARFTAPITSGTSLIFSDQSINSSSTSQSITFTNLSDLVLNISSITVSSDFSQTNNCGTTLTAGASCTIQVSFIPSSLGSHSGTLAVLHDGSGGSSSVALSGVGIANNGSNSTNSSQGASFLTCHLNSSAPRSKIPSILFYFLIFSWILKRKIFS